MKQLHSALTYNLSIMLSNDFLTIFFSFFIYSNKIKLNRKRKMTWLNPPFNLKTKTKISKLLLNLLDNHFPPYNKLRKFFNRTNVKISYSCMPDMNSYTYMHNRKVLNDKHNETGD